MTHARSAQSRTPLSDSTRQRVLIIGGLAESLVNFRWPLLLALSRLGLHVHACAAGENPVIAQRLADIGAEYHPIYLKRSGLNPVDDARTFFSIKNLIEKTNPDIVLAYTIKPVVYGMLAARSCRIEHTFALITGLGYSFTDTGNAFSPIRRAVQIAAKLLYRKSLHQVKHVFFQNPDDQQLFVRQKLIAEKQSRSIINGSGVDIDYFSPSPLPSAPVFLLIARLLKDKGIREYVEAASIVKRNHSAARFLLVGPLDPNPSSISLEELHQWTSDGLIEYQGALDDVRSAIKEASVYVLPSYREGTPRTVLEAMAMGRPVITTDVPGCRETVTPGVNGLLVPHQNGPELADAMEHLARNPELRAEFGKNSRKIVVAKYDSQQVAATMVERMGLIA